MRRILSDSIVMGALSGGTFVAVFFAAPEFAEVFDRLKITLPVSTNWILRMPGIGWLVLAFLVGAGSIVKDFSMPREKAEVINAFMMLVMLICACSINLTMLNL